MTHVIKEGYLECLARGVGEVQKWTRRYYILRGVHEKAIARLDYFESKEESRSSTKHYKSVLLENLNPSSLSAYKSTDGQFYEIKIEQSTPSGRSQIQILKYRTKDKKDWDEWRKLLLREIKRPKSGFTSPAVDVRVTSHSFPEPQAEVIDCVDSGEFDSIGSMDENFIYESLDNRTVKVQVVKTDAATTCQLTEQKTYILSITSQHLALNTIDGGNKTLYVWPYKYIRRFGIQKNALVFEAGRKCSSGPGMFTLRSTDVPAETVQDWIQQQTKQIQSKEHIGQDLSQNKEHARKNNSSPVMVNSQVSEQLSNSSLNKESDYYNTGGFAGRSQSPPADYDERCYYNQKDLVEQRAYTRQDSTSGPEIPKRGYGQDSMKKAVAKSNSVQGESPHVPLQVPQNVDKSSVTGNVGVQQSRMLLENKLSFTPPPPVGPAPPPPVAHAASPPPPPAASNKKEKDEGKGVKKIFRLFRKKDSAPTNTDENHYDDPAAPYASSGYERQYSASSPDANLYSSTYETQVLTKPKNSDLVAELKRQKGQVPNMPLGEDEDCYDTVSIDKPMPGKRTSTPQFTASSYDEVSISQQSKNIVSRVMVNQPPVQNANDIDDPNYESVAR